MPVFVVVARGNENQDESGGNGLMNASVRKNSSEDSGADLVNFGGEGFLDFAA
jgi:hypothetical protein